ncbi:MAG: hypothetical protein M3Q94_12000 [Pseudomonadota bacterium]|nr:hypothetical protein [Pseudomonadota bacterium]
MAAARLYWTMSARAEMEFDRAFPRSMAAAESIMPLQKITMSDANFTRNDEMQLTVVF